MEIRRSTLHLLLTVVMISMSASSLAQDRSKPRRTVTGLPRYMTDIPQPIPDQLRIVNAPTTARRVACFSSFSHATAMVDVVRKCGVPDEHQGSGIYIFLYDIEDGSVVAIGTADLKRLLYVTHVRPNRTISLLHDKQVSR